MMQTALEGEQLHTGLDFLQGVEQRIGRREQSRRAAKNQLRALAVFLLLMVNATTISILYNSMGKDGEAVAELNPGKEEVAQMYYNDPLMLYQESE